MAKKKIEAAEIIIKTTDGGTFKYTGKPLCIPKFLVLSSFNTIISSNLYSPFFNFSKSI